MRISFTPQRRDDTLTLELTAPDRIRINGDLFNFGPLSDGGMIPAGTIPCDAIFGPVERIDGDIHITLRLPVPANCTDPWMCFPEPLTVTEDGPVDIPFATSTETREEPVEGGIRIITTTRRWHEPDEVREDFIRNTVTEEDPADVDA